MFDRFRKRLFDILEFPLVGDRLTVRNRPARRTVLAARQQQAQANHQRGRQGARHRGTDEGFLGVHGYLYRSIGLNKT